VYRIAEMWKSGLEPCHPYPSTADNEAPGNAMICALKTGDKADVKKAVAGTARKG